MGKKFFVILLFPLFLLADQKVVTNDGKIVVLHDDGTWSYQETSNTPKVYKFRNMNWGDSKQQIKIKEKEKLINERDDNLSYKGILDNNLVEIDYFFFKNQLYYGLYSFVEKHANENLYLNDYNTIKENLIKKYGNPTDDKTYWNDDLYKDNYSRWGMAVSVGHLSFITTWSGNQTEMRLQLTGDNYEIRHSLLYYNTFLYEQYKNNEIKNSNY